MMSSFARATSFSAVPPSGKPTWASLTWSKFTGSSLAMQAWYWL